VELGELPYVGSETGKYMDRANTWNTARLRSLFTCISLHKPRYPVRRL